MPSKSFPENVRILLKSLILHSSNNDFNILGWETTDIYQNKVETLISNVEKNIDIDLSIFKVQNYIN